MLFLMLYTASMGKTGKFSVFYERCPVLKADEPARSSRLILCQLTAEVLRRGLDLLGIQTIEQM